jgi:acyl-CoA synthetase (AMP-forming)/AMP-acid ligase II
VGESDWQVLRDLLIYRAGQDPDRLAFADSEHQLTYAGLADRADLRAGALRAMGVGPGDRVALVMAAGIPLVEMFWALQVIGAVPCLFNPRVPAETLTRRVELVRPSMVVTDALAREMSLSRGAPAGTDPDPDDLAFLQLTSGTSGAPRASMILQRNVMAYLRTSRSDRTFGSDDVFVSWVPPWHDLGLVRFFIGAVYHGAICHIVEPAVRTIPQWLAAISRVGGTYTAAPDFAYRLAVRMVDPATVDLSSLRFAKSGGEPVRWSSVRAFEERFSLPGGVVVPGYGLGEATLGVSEHVPGEKVPVDGRGNVSCGVANRGLEVEAGSSAHAPREILVRGETVFAGYFEAPEETSRTLRDGWLHTGDTGYLDSDGHLFVLGRREGMIKRAGSLIAPRELEEAAQRAEGVRVAAATSIRDAQDHTDAIVVAVEAEVSSRRPADQIAGDVSREVVAALGFAPGRVCVLPPRSIPRTENGKVRHSRLQTLLHEGLCDGGPAQ